MDEGAGEQSLADWMLASVDVDYRVRMRAATALARFADVPEVAARLGDLILDDHDTAVTLAAVTALVARLDTAGVAIIATSLPRADDQHTDWIETGVWDGIDTSKTAQVRVLEVCHRLAHSATPDVGAGLPGLVSMVSQVVVW